MRRMSLAVVVLCVFAAVSHVQGQVARNVIIMIADGQGFNTVEATRYYTGQTPVQMTFELQAAVSTYSASGLQRSRPYPDARLGYDPAKAWYVDYPSWPGLATDSSSAATAIYTGIRTHDGMVSMATDGKTPLITIAEIADYHGKATGAVSTVQWCHATPGSFWAHSPSRGNYADIAREMVYESGLDVIIGAGHPGYDDNGAARTTEPAKWDYKCVGGQETWQQLLSGTTGRGWTFTDSKARLDYLRAMLKKRPAP